MTMFHKINFKRFWHTAMPILFLLALCPICNATTFVSAFDNVTEVTYYWKTQNGKKALAKKEVSKDKAKCSDVVLTPFKYDVNYGGKGKFRIYNDRWKLHKEYGKRDRDYFFDNYSILNKEVEFSGKNIIHYSIHFAVKTDDGYGFIDEKGSEIIPCKYSKWSLLTMQVLRKKGVLFFLDSFDDTGLWYDDNYRCHTYIQLTTNDGKWQCMVFDSLYRESDEYDYDETKPFSHYWEYEFGWSDKSFRINSNIERNQAFSEYTAKSKFNPVNRYIAIRKGNKWGIFDLNRSHLKERVPCKYDESSFFYPGINGLAITLYSSDIFFMKKGARLCMVNDKGEELLDDNPQSKYPNLVVANDRPQYVASNGRKYDLYNECFMVDNFNGWLDSNWSYESAFEPVYTIKENGLYGLYNGKHDKKLLPCKYKGIHFDSRGFLYLALPDNDGAIGCLTNAADTVIMLNDRSEIVNHCTITSDKDGYLTYRRGDGYGFCCKETGIYTAPVFTPDTVRGKNETIPTCVFYRHTSNNTDGGFIGNQYFSPSYRDIYGYNDKEKGEAIELKKRVYGNGYCNKDWIETVYYEGEELKCKNNWSQWCDYLEKDNPHSVYNALDSIFKDLGYELHRAYWCYAYGIALWKNNSFESAIAQLKRVKNEFGLDLVEKGSIENAFTDWTNYAILSSDYSDAFLSMTKAHGEGMEIDKVLLKKILHDGPLHYAETGDYESAIALYQNGVTQYGIDEGQSFLNLLQSTYNLYLARKERTAREEDAKREKEEQERQLAIQREQQAAQQRLQHQQDVLNSVLNGIAQITQAISDYAARKNGSSTTYAPSSTYSTTSSTTRTSSSSPANTSSRKKVHPNMNSLRYTYDKWISRLIDMNVNYEKKYNNSERIKCQQEARDIRIMAEQYSNCSVFKSKWEDWDGRKQ